MNCSGEGVDRSHDDRARAYALARVDIYPLIVWARHRKHGVVRRADVIGLLAARCRLLFEIAARRDQATTALESGAKHRLGGDRLGAGVKR